MNLAVVDLYHQFQYQALDKLLAQDDIHIRYVLTGTKENSHGDLSVIQDISQRIFAGGTTVESIVDFLFPNVLVRLSNEPWLLNESILASCKHIESISLRTSDRNCAFPISVQDRRQNYLIILNHFFHIIGDMEITHLLAFDTPHSFFSTILHELAKHLNLPVIRMEYHFLPNHSLIIDQYDFPKIPRSYRKSETTATLWNALPDSIKKAYVGENRFLSSLNKKEKSNIIGKGPFSQLKVTIRWIKRVGMNLTMGALPFLFKREILHFTSLNNMNNRLFYRFSINIPLWSLLQLNHYYNKLSENPDLNKKYIFFGMHMQPEKTSQPLGREFDSQIIPIKILSQSVPEDWMIYVKEHPNQFNERKIVNNNYRSTVFYDALAKIPKVRLVTLDSPSKDLIEQSQLVSTLTGTLGWEALKMGKAVINFGDPYYQACSATRNVDSVESCKAALSQLINLSGKDIEESLYRYLLYYSEKNHLVESANWESKFAFSDIPREQQINNIKDRISELINN